MSRYVDGICPLCGHSIDYIGSYDHDDEGATLNFECSNCGATGKAGYDFVFDGYYCVKDSNGEYVVMEGE